VERTEDKKKLKTDSDVEGCKEILMITSDSCPICAEAKDVFKKELESGKITVKPIEEGEGKNIADALDLTGVPSFVCKIGDGTLRKLDKDEIAGRFLEKEEEKDDENLKL